MYIIKISTSHSFVKYNAVKSTYIYIPTYFSTKVGCMEGTGIYIRPITVYPTSLVNNIVEYFPTI